MFVFRTEEGKLTSWASLNHLKIVFPTVEAGSFVFRCKRLDGLEIDSQCLLQSISKQMIRKMMCFLWIFCDSV